LKFDYSSKELRSSGFIIKEKSQMLTRGWNLKVEKQNLKENKLVNVNRK
jgi:hypothetical protein